MKKKLLSIVALAMTMAMATSAMAAPSTGVIGPVLRGSGDVDGDGQVTANDVMMILKGIATDADVADIDGSDTNDGVDGVVAYKTVLQPKTVVEDLNVRIKLPSYEISQINILHADQVGSEVVDGDKGMGEVDVTTANINASCTIKQAIDEAVEAAIAGGLNGINNQLDRIYFHSNVKGDVYLRSLNGWSMFANALRYIVPMDPEMAAYSNKQANATPVDVINADPVLKQRYDALNEIKNILIDPSITDPAQMDDSDLTADEIRQMKELFYIAIPGGDNGDALTDEEVANTASEVLKITDTKYDVTVTYNGNTESLKSDTVAATQFIQDVQFLKNYGVMTVADYRNTFGDKVVASSINTAKSDATPVEVVIEVAETAKVDSNR